MRISDWSSDVCSSDLLHGQAAGTVGAAPLPPIGKARTMPHQAGCLCGRVRIAIDAEPLAARMCWCRLCQYLGGGSGTVNVCFPSDRLTVTGEVRWNYSIRERSTAMRPCDLADRGTPPSLPAAPRP